MEDKPKGNMHYVTQFVINDNKKAAGYYLIIIFKIDFGMI
jgi:hypothetical protein